LAAIFTATEIGKDKIEFTVDEEYVVTVPGDPTTRQSP
jgi:hypothetical protein